MQLRHAAVLYLAITLLLAYPLALNPASSAMPGDPDTDLFIWTLAWNTHALTSAPLSVFDANIYFPHRRTLAFSENLLGSTLFAAPVLWTTGDPLLALNVVALSSIVFSGMGAFVLARRLGMGAAAAVVCGLFFAFSPARFFRLGQIHLTTIQWVPFCLAYLHAYLDDGRRSALRLAVAFFTLQALTSGHGAVFLVTSIAALLAYRFLLGGSRLRLGWIRDLGVPGALLLAPLALLFIPYRYVQNEFGLRRSLEGWETPVSSFFASHTPVHAWLFDLLDVSFTTEPSAVLFPGFLILMLAAVALAPRRLRSVPPQDRPRRSESRQTVGRTWRALAVVCTAMSLLGTAAAVYVHLVGPIRLRVRGELLFSARDPLRPWIVAALALVARMALARQAPLDVAARLGRVRAAWRRLGAPRGRDMASFYAFLTILSFLLSAGPPLGLWPLVYDLPGFNFLRVPSRFVLLGVLGLAVLAAYGFERLSARLSSPRRTLAATVVGAVVVAECFTIPLPGYREYAVTIPAADRHLSGAGDAIVVAELPTDHHNERRQSTFMLHSMAHWQKTVHGHSGIRTPLHQELYAKMRGFPSDDSLDAMARLGVTHIVVHPAMYDPRDWERASAALPAFSGRLAEIFNDGDSRVYLLRAAVPAAAGRGDLKIRTRRADTTQGQPRGSATLPLPRPHQQPADAGTDRHSHRDQPVGTPLHR